jgi:sodium-dependent dicarboxylate transporter 2/3/5
LLSSNAALLKLVSVACSFGFMMPAGTPPNAIVFASGYLRMKDMYQPGFFLNMIGILVLTAWSVLVGPLLFPEALPTWATTA